MRLDDLDDIDYGLAMDIIIEAANDNCKYKELATQDDIRRTFGR